MRTLWLSTLTLAACAAKEEPVPAENSAPTDEAAELAAPGEEAGASVKAEDLVVVPEPGIAPPILCATAAGGDGVFRGELQHMAQNAWSLSGSWQPHTVTTKEAWAVVTWTGSNQVMHDSLIPAELPAGVLHLSLHPTRVGMAASGAIQTESGRLAISCMQGTPVPSVRYEAGECLDAEGNPGLNHWPIELVRETRSGECNDFAGMQLNEGLMDYPSLEGWSLRGARLDGADLVFSHVVDADLAGAQFGEMSFGYATIRGSIDAHTAYPADLCERDEDRIHCSQ